MTRSSEVTIALELAETCVPFARSNEAKAERWLRVLRRFDRTGEALGDLGVPDGPLESPAEARVAFEAGHDGPSVEEVAERAASYAHARGGRVVGTVDLLFGVLCLFGKDFSRALYRHGVTREQLLERLALQVERQTSPHIG